MKITYIFQYLASCGRVAHWRLQMYDHKMLFIWLARETTSQCCWNSVYVYLGHHIMYSKEEIKEILLLSNLSAQGREQNYCNQLMFIYHPDCVHWDDLCTMLCTQNAIFVLSQPGGHSIWQCLALANLIAPDSSWFILFGPCAGVCMCLSGSTYIHQLSVLVAYILCTFDGA